MGNSASYSISSSADISGQQLVATFEGNGGSVSYQGIAGRYCSRVTLVSGDAPSYAFVSFPVKDFPTDELGPTCALQNTGPAGAIKPKTRCSIALIQNGKSVVIFTGTLLKYSHCFEEDSVIAEIYDDRHTLSKITVFGRMIYDPVTKAHYYDATSPCTFNALGYPDLIDSPFGPRFAPSHRYGYKQAYGGTNEDYTQPGAGQATSRARSWTCQDAITYLRDCHYARPGYSRPFSQVDLGNLSLPSYIIWPEAAGSIVGSDRVLHNVNLNNLPLSAVLQEISRRAGAYDLYTAPSGTFNSEIKFLDMNPKSTTGTTLYLPEYIGAIGACMQASNVIYSGYVSESAVNLFDDVCICGDAPAVERFCSTGATGTGAVYLEQAWSAANQLAFSIYCASHGNDAEAFRAASTIFPDVFCAYRVSRGADIWSGTKWSGFHNGGLYAKIKPAQLTGYNEDDANPRNWIPRGIVVEYRVTAYEEANLPAGKTPWIPAARYDGLTLSPDQEIVYLPVLRDTLASGSSAGQSWFSNIDPNNPPSGYPGVYAGQYLARREVRLNLALEADWPLTGRAGKGGAASDDPNGTNARINGAAPKFTYQSVASSMDYVEYLRQATSRPNGEGRIDPVLAFFPAKAAQGDELFTDRIDATTGRLPNHAVARNKNVKRIEYSGVINVQGLNPAFYPGLGCTIEGSNTIPCFGVMKCVVFDATGDQLSSVEFGSPDSSVIYDSPSGPRAGYSSAPSGSIASSTPYDPYDHPREDKKLKTETTTTGDYENGYNETPKETTKAETKASGKDERSAAQRRSDRVENIRDAYNDAAPNSKQKKNLENLLRGAEKQDENKRGVEQGKAQQRANQGTINGKSDITDSFLGKNNSGTINGKSDITDSFLGKGNSGTIGGKSDLNDVARSGFDTKKSDAANEKSYKAGREKENARQTKQNDEAAKRMGEFYKKQSAGQSHPGEFNKRFTRDANGQLVDNGAQNRSAASPPVSAPVSSGDDGLSDILNKTRKAPAKVLPKGPDDE